MAVSVSTSRFALLKIEGSDDEEQVSKGKKHSSNPRKGDSGSSKSTLQKRKNKKKHHDDVADLRSLAFGGAKSSATVNRPNTSAGSNTSQYESWAEHDKDQVDEIFQNELQQAILMSKVDLEKKADVMSSLDNGNQTESLASKKQKKGKKKSKSMSIDEFQHGALQSDQTKEELRSDKRKLVGSGDNFFEGVEAGAAQIVKQDKLQAEYQKEYKVQAVLQAKHNTELEDRDQTIEHLQTELHESQEDLKRVKKRNKQLCFILGQGEMKEKAEILEQVDSLVQIKDELTAQVTILTSDLEKERSKVHSLQNELSKSKIKSK